MLNLQRPEGRRELAQFVRERRTRTKPQDVGLPPGARRRTPGLRREEVAQLAGVSVTWYTWFEQGRDIQVSTGFLDKVSAALCLDEAERSYLVDLARRRSAATAESSATVTGLPVPAAAMSQAVALRRRDAPPLAVNVNRPNLVSVRPAADAESNRIHESIRKVLVAEEARPATPATATGAAGSRARTFLRLGVGMTLLSAIMLVPY